MTSILRDMAEIVWAAAPELRVFGIGGPKTEDESYGLWRRLWADIRPIKYGNTVTWNSSNTYSLARYAIPYDYSHLIMRVECYSVDWAVGATNQGVRLCPPPGQAYWQLEQVGSQVAQVITAEDMPIQVMLEQEEFLILRGGYEAVLIGTFTAPPDDDKTVRTFVQGYNIGSEITERIGSNQASAITTG